MILSCLSLLPFLLIGLPADIWAYSNAAIFLFFSLWSYSITRTVLTKNHYDKNLRLGKFSIVLVIATLYVVFLSCYYARTFNNDDDPKWVLLVILIGHSFLFYSIFYLVNFIAKAIATVEFKKTTTFDGYSRYFFLFLIFPIGIWWLYFKIQLATKS